MANNISPLAYVHPEAKLGDNVSVGAFVYIDKNVEIGDGCHIHSHTSILSGARIGNNCRIYEGCVISATPQDFRWKGEESMVIIGEDTMIREHVIINRSIREGEATRIGNGCFIMAQCHIGHDSYIGRKCVLGNSCKIAGDCHISHCTILSSGVIVHERNDIGSWVLVKGGTRVTSNIPPYVIMAHNPISYFGINSYILKRGNKSDSIIDDIAKCYRHIYNSPMASHNAVRRIEEDIPQSKERDNIISFLNNHQFKIAGSLLEDDL